jgi:hypothetical protein
MGELIKATTKKKFLMLTTTWTKRFTPGRWVIQLGYSPDQSGSESGSL